MSSSMQRTWKTEDFNSLSWHDNLVRLLVFPSADLLLAFHIDHILQWIPPKNPEDLYSFKVAPAVLSFSNVLELSVRLDFGHSSSLYIDEIYRKKASSTVSKKFWRYSVQTDKGNIQFLATDFAQRLTGPAKVSKSQKLDL